MLPSSCCETFSRYACGDAQAALLRLTEVVGVEDARDVVLQIDGDQPLFRISVSLQIRRVDDGERRVEIGELRFRGWVVEDVLHRGDVRIRLLDDQPRGDA